MFLLAALLVNPSYKPLTGVIREKLEVHYDGYLPILGGQEGKADAVVSFSMAPGTPKTQAPVATPPTQQPEPVITPPPVQGGNGDASPIPATAPVPKPTNPTIPAMAVKLTLINFGLKFNGFSLPIQQENAKRFFPGTQFDFDQNGKVLATDIPNVKVPFRLPGLDVQRIPELAFLPFQFPTEGLQPGIAFHNHFVVDGVSVDLTVTPRTPVGNKMVFSFARHETYTVLEDSSDSVVEDEKDAVNKVETTITGSGTATFDLGLGRFVQVVSADQAISHVTNVATKETSTRRLRRKLVLSAP